MTYLKFDKDQLINLQYSLNREILRSNRTGSYMSTSLNGCNTRKYHGLLVCPLKQFGEEKHVLLSSLDVSVIRKEEEINLGIHQYQGGIINPHGYEYIHNIEFGHLPKITYRIDDILLSVESNLSEQKEQVFIRYSIHNTDEPTTLRFKPFLAFRNIHNLSRANNFVNTKYHTVENGICMKMYDGYPDLYMQFSKKNEYISAPDWYYNFEYLKELQRGYDYQEDLFVPGFFELEMMPDESIVFVAGITSTKPNSFKQQFTREKEKHTQRLTFTSSLRHAARQFILQKNKETTFSAGFPWYDSITRQSFISLPGMVLATRNINLYSEVLNTYKKYLKDGLFPDNIFSTSEKYCSADAPLWYIWAVQKFIAGSRWSVNMWYNFSNSIKEILEAYRNSVPGFITMTPDGLIEAKKENTSLTWMNSYVHGRPVVQRAGLAVEINALWYHAISFALEMSYRAGDEVFIKSWKDLQKKTGNAFIKTFWNQGHRYLADVVDNGFKDWSVRPNMVIAASMKYSPLSKENKKQILSVATHKLLTNRGLRSLSSDHIRYRGVVEGNFEERESAMHQGAVWPWLIQFFTEAYLDVHGSEGCSFLKNHLEMYEEALTENCIGTFSEVYNGEPPHTGNGAVSQAWNVAGIYYAHNLVKNFKP